MATSSSVDLVETFITNYARLGHAAQELLPELLKEIVRMKQPLQTLRPDCLANSYLKKNLRPVEWQKINNAVSNGFDTFDVNLLYKLIRNLQLVSSPTRDWDYPIDPMANELTLGDDIERIRRIRNAILHRGNTKVTHLELEETFKIFKDMAARIEIYLAKPNGELVNKFEELEKRSMDQRAEEQFTQTIENLAKRETDIREDLKQIQIDQERQKGIYAKEIIDKMFSLFYPV